MSCEIVFLAVGNADTILLNPDDDSTVIVDLHKIPLLRKSLQNRQINSIGRIYITHEHRDHFPKIEKLVTFLEDWIQSGGEIKEFCLPYEAYKNAAQKVLSNRNENKRLEDALLRLKDWEQKRIIRFLEPTSGDVYEENNLNIEVLHPGHIYAQDHLATVRGKHNEISLVLKINYGHFTALLLADIEGEGLEECIHCNKEKLKGNIVKIPHHGGYPSNGDTLRQLLNLIDPEKAILSVGSTNSYGHVKPELFSLLVDLKNNNSKQLEDFVCTEVTRTCVYSQKERDSMGRSGLSEKKLCAGEITVTAEVSGQWTFTTGTDHENVISNLGYPACRGKAELI